MATLPIIDTETRADLSLQKTEIKQKEMFSIDKVRNIYFSKNHTFFLKMCDLPAPLYLQISKMFKISHGNFQKNNLEISKHPENSGYFFENFKKEILKFPNISKIFQKDLEPFLENFKKNF